MYGVGQLELDTREVSSIHFILVFRCDKCQFGHVHNPGTFSLQVELVTILHSLFIINNK